MDELDLEHKPENFWGGQISNRLSAWKSLTSDSWVLNCVKGVRIPLLTEPVQLFVPKPYKFAKAERLAVTATIGEMLEKGIIEHTYHSEGEWISNIFPKPKPDGSVRVILDLSDFNELVEYQHFKMSSLGTALDLIQRDSFMSSIDLKDAYYSVLIFENDRKYLKFEWEGSLYQYRVLPNGLACAPRYFTKILQPIFTAAHLKGINCFPYIDDICIVADTAISCAEAVRELAKDLDAVGLVVHPVKSELTPSKKLKFLGFYIDTRNMVVTLPQEKIENFEQKALKLLSKEDVKIRHVARLVGYMVAYTQAVDYGLLYQKALEKDKNEALVLSKGNFESRMVLSLEARDDIFWWLENIRKAKRIIRPATPDIYIESDASMGGWGCYVNGTDTGGPWKPEEIAHINVLEIKAIYFALLTFCRTPNLQIHVATDNTTAMAYVRKMGGVRSSECNAEAQAIWGWAEQNRSWITVSYLPGKLNVRADAASRNFKQNLEWELAPKVFNKIVRIFGMPEIDLFASRLNAKCPLFVSWGPDPEAMHYDAFSLNWTGLNVYLFPPFSVLPRVTRKLKEERPARWVLVVPDWPSATWYTTVMALTPRSIKFGKKRGNVIMNSDLQAKFPEGVPLRALTCYLRN